MKTQTKRAYPEIISERRSALTFKCAAFLPAKAAITLEVGCGHGHFLTAYAQAHPNQLCIGIDIVLDRVERAERKCRRARLSNLHFMHADAHDFIAALPEDARFAAVYMLFPDPWPKRRHHKNRLLKTSFLHTIALRAGQGARFYFRTDFEPYFQEAVATFATHPDWKREPEAAWSFEMPTVFQEKAASYHSLVAEHVH